MGRFNLMHCIPHPRMHGLNGYKEVIDTVAWGLRELGHEVTYTINKFELGSTNIIFGAQVLPIEFLEKLPEDSIVYNFEQRQDYTPAQLNEEQRRYGNRFQIWDYSPQNIGTWNSIGITSVKTVPIGYAPILNRIEKPAHQDIDVLLYGVAGEARLNAFYLLSRAGMSAVFVSGLYGDARDSLISRSKIVLNISFHQTCPIFEVVRVSYLLSNKKAVVAILEPNTLVPAGIDSCVKFTSLETIVDDCRFLLDNDSARTDLENSGFDFFSKFDIREILNDVL